MGVFLSTYSLIEIYTAVTVVVQYCMLKTGQNVTFSMAGFINVTWHDTQDSQNNRRLGDCAALC
jgi:hypothetical protein